MARDTCQNKNNRYHALGVGFFALGVGLFALGVEFFLH